MSRWWICTVLLVVLLDGITAPPVTTKTKEDEEGKEDDERKDDPDFGLEYERYLKEVVGVLESDDAFRQKLQDSNISEIKHNNGSGEIARHLEFVNHGIRTKLDEIKRKEIDRLRGAMKIQRQMERGLKKMGHESPVRIDPKRVLAHLDHNNPNSFEVEDLAKLIKQASNDLDEIDKQRRSDFKTYEMEKEAEKRDKLNHMDEEHRKTEEAKLAEMKQKHAEHPKMHHPGSKDQLEEVWEESDGMKKEDFDPKTFFTLHDTNGDGVLDEAEVEALFQKELDKVYDPDNPEDDMMERYEEMNRMREHVFGEVDTNKDSLITLEEFMKSTKLKDFDEDEGWKGLDEEEDPYTDDELEQYVREYEERQRQQFVDQGHVPPVDPSAIHDQGQGHDDLGQGQGFGQPVQMHQQQQQQQQVEGDHLQGGQGEQLKFQHHQPTGSPQGQGRGHHQAQGQRQHQGQDQGRERPQNPRVPTNI